MNRRYNLIDEPWVPVTDLGRVSLKQIFTEFSFRALGGNPVEKIAITKLLLAIAQAACTPKNDAAWKELGSTGMAEKCSAYLQKWYDQFWLYGDKPFLQMPAVVDAKLQPFGAVLPEVATGNTTVLIQSHIEKELSDAERAMLLLVLMGFSLGGKKVDNKIVLTLGYKGKRNDKGKPSTGKSGSSVGYMGYMHSYLLADNLVNSLWLNLLTAEQIKALEIYTKGLGTAPWECMPTGEADPIAESLKNSYMGRLIPLGRFCLLEQKGLHYSEGIAHASHKDNVYDPSIAVSFAQKAPKALWVDPQKRPWRELTALLSFMGSSTIKGGFDCHQIKYGLTRAKEEMPIFCIWSGGLRVSSNAGEQYVSGTDDYVESSITLQKEWIGALWYEGLTTEMQELEKIAKRTYGATIGFFKTQQMDGMNQAKQCSSLFWQLCEREFQQLVGNCEDQNKTRVLRRTFSAIAYRAYDAYCPKETARQLDAWAKNRPHLPAKYLSET